MEIAIKLFVVGLVLICFYNPTHSRARLLAIPVLSVGVAVCAVLFFFLLIIVRRISCSGTGTIQLATDPVAGGYKQSLTRNSTLVTRPTLGEELRNLDWFQFEKLTELLYLKRGYVVKRSGGANPDGGIDLVVGTGEDRMAVQCKHWKNREVGVRQVREFVGALHDARIRNGVFIGLNGFTADARDLASRHRIELIGELELLRLLHAAHAECDPAFRALFESHEKVCPRCENEMVLRTARKGANPNSTFWGCITFPRCRYTMET